MKTHILREDGERTICGRRKNDFLVIAKNAKVATCTTCMQRMILKETDDDSGGLSRVFTEKQLRFAAHPLVATNMAQAARDAGYSESMTSDTYLGELRKRLAPLVSHFQRERAARFSVSKERIQHELAAIGLANILDYVNVDEETGEVTTKKLSELTRDQAAAIQEYSLMPIKKIDKETGEEVEVQVLRKIKLFDKRSALVDLGKTIGMFTDKMNLVLPGNSSGIKEDVPLNKLSTEALEQIHKIVLKAASEVESAQQDTKSIPGQCAVVSDGKQ